MLIQKATTDVTVYVRVIDSTDGTPETSVAYNTAGVDLWYMREGSDHVSITEATQTAGGAHSDGGFVHISDGMCRLDLPDAACETGVDHVVVGGTFTGMIVIPVYIDLVSYNPFDSVRMGMTALPNAAADAAGGLPVSDAGGLDIDTLLGYLTAAVATASALATAQSDLDTITGADGVTLATAQGNYAPNTVVPDAAGTAPTAVEIRTEMDTNSTQLAAIVADTNELQGDDVPGLIAALNNISTAEVNTEADTALSDFFTSVAALVDAIWDEAKAGHAGAGSFGEEVQSHFLSSEGAALNDLSSADVATEISDALTVDTHAQPGQGAPAATTTVMMMLAYLYKWARNQRDNDGSTTQFYNDNGSTVDQKQTTSESGGTTTVGEMASGP